MLQRLLDACPGSRGDLPPDETARTRSRWYGLLAKTDSQRVEFSRLASTGGATPLIDTRRPQQHRDEERRYSRREGKRAALVEGS